MKVKQLLLVVLVSVLSAFAGLYIYGRFFKSPTSSFGAPINGKLPANYASFTDANGNAAAPTDFTKASVSAIPAVVHIKTRIPAKKITNNIPNSRGSSGDPFEDFFGDMFGGSMGPQIRPEQKASGSGVIISQDGYIVTNNHVVVDQEGNPVSEIKVSLNEGKKVYNAKIVGRDANTDLAVLKIDATNLPYLVYGNSNDVQLGQWVLAVGYPFTLEATVTAGIVSAKGRSIGINSSQSNSPVESFIQTDAAVNPGNSGGALINTNGELIGINSAILAPTGTYAGYSFAIPVSIVKKVVNDIVKFGNVKRGYLGVQYDGRDGANETYLKRLGLQSDAGVYITQVPADGGAAKAGIKKGDVITKINGQDVTTGIAISGQIASSQPGDKITLSYLRGGKEYTTDVTLTASAGKVSPTSNLDLLQDQLGVDLKNADPKSLTKYRVSGGVEVTNIRADGPLKRTRMEKGFIITSVNGQDIKNTDEFLKVLSSMRSSTVQLEGIYPGYNGVYTYQINLNGDDDSSGSF
ncbi:MAG: trypsin-like peptidase domain-containing protein [Niabella sp.]